MKVDLRMCAVVLALALMAACSPAENGVQTSVSAQVSPSAQAVFPAQSLATPAASPSLSPSASAVDEDATYAEYLSINGISRTPAAWETAYAEFLQDLDNTPLKAYEAAGYNLSKTSSDNWRDEPNLIKTFKENCSNLGLLDFDMNGVPELFLEYIIAEAVDLVFTFKNGKVVYLFTAYADISTPNNFITSWYINLVRDKKTGEYVHVSFDNLYYWNARGNPEGDSFIDIYPKDKGGKPLRLMQASLDWDAFRKEYEPYAEKWNVDEKGLKSLTSFYWDEDYIFDIFPHLINAWVLDTETGKKKTVTPEEYLKEKREFFGRYKSYENFKGYGNYNDYWLWFEDATAENIYNLVNSYAAASLKEPPWETFWKEKTK